MATTNHISSIDSSSFVAVRVVVESRTAISGFVKIGQDRILIQVLPSSDKHVGSYNRLVIFFRTLKETKPKRNVIGYRV